MSRASYKVVKQSWLAVWIVDLDGAVSVTNDAEAVCREMHAEWPGHRVYYRDTDGNWDELVMNGDGVFLHFHPARVMGVLYEHS